MTPKKNVRKRAGKKPIPIQDVVMVDVLQPQTLNRVGDAQGVTAQENRPMQACYVTKVIPKVPLKRETKTTFSDGTVEELSETYPAVHRVWE